MIPEIGHFALSLALFVALAQATIGLIGAERRDVPMMGFATSAALVQLGLIVVAYASLTTSYVVSDFSVLNVASNSHTLKPLLYKISGVWGNHEGSMLLWVLILAVFGAAVAAFGGNLPASLKARVLGVHAMIGVAFLAFVLLTSNPFIRLFPAPPDGRGLNPVLQDPGLAIHPPLLYLGYVGFSMAFSFAIAALLEGRVDAAWGRWVRPWTLAAWTFLTGGIALGSWWAYYELGWGGWWFWDPVENASFMPWLVGTALLHSATVVEKRDALKSWTIFLAILAFALAILGTFVVRSGVLTSVHSFASDPARGIFILVILAATVGGAFTLYALRAPALAPGGLFRPFSREGGLVLNNVILALVCATVFLGTFYPLGVELATAGQTRVSVGAPYFNLTFGLIMVPLVLAMAAAPYLTWKRAGPMAVLRKLRPAAIAAVIAIAVAYIAVPDGPWLAPLAMGLAAWVAVGSLADWTTRIKLFAGRPADALARLRGLPRAATGFMLAHLGVAIIVAGITGASAWQTETVEIVRPGATLSVAGYELELGDIVEGSGPNYNYQRLEIDVTRGGHAVARLMPERRFFPVSGQHTTEAAIRTDWKSDLYIALGEPDRDGNWAITVFYNPMVPWIWLGALVMVIGGGFSLSDRRHRLGLPKRAAALQATPEAKPADAAAAAGTD
ncbi:MAG: heme lyase CcmF/NrfE family subunit [Alphaproteobacteria bacterium]|nr:heme lyase CcmF/NrfE family subunit [Alphaproteobacteria bacterium]MCZ6763476.1 heme lyase CcmF/NrfE family subunit [Alphaproteobacteria bacterium]